MGMQRGVAVSVVTMLLMVGLTMGLSSRIEWSALRELRSSLGIRAKDWPIKTEPCRNWTGVQCRNGRVVGINVSGLRRTRLGKLNQRFEVDSLVNFTLLESFNASGFLLNGSIPVWFGQSLGALQVLDLSSCFITGLIPDSIGRLSALKVLFLSGNGLVGTMPSTLGLLSNLSALNLSGNSLSGTLPNSLSKLGNLRRLDLSSNYLSGSVPPELGALSRLQILNLSGNSLIAAIPSQLGKLSKLFELDLSMNFLSESLPAGLFSSGLLGLKILSLKGNLLVGALPATLGSLRSLQFLDVSSNNLTGTLPNFSSWNVSSGAVFNLSNNLFYGPLNVSLDKFKMIDLSSNYLEGEMRGGGDVSHVSVARNCLPMLPNPRDLDECRAFYMQRNLPFVFPESESRHRRRVIIILAGVFGGLGIIVLLTLVLILVLKQCHNRKSLEVQSGTKDGGPVPKGESPPPPKDPVFVTAVGEAFSFEQILGLTGNFAEANILKHGHSGDLFLGTLENGATVVVKTVDVSLFKRESYIVELGLLSKVSHARLVPILGHCLENENVKCIIYKYMPNGDLASSLHRVIGPDGKLQSLDWITRLKIAIGAAEGLAYLHECIPPFVHRDVQASSILLDDKFEVRLGSLTEVTAQGDLHQRVISRVFSKPLSSNPGDSGKSSVTCAYDVYCFGKILLELVTGNIEVSKSDDASTKVWLEQTLPYISIYDKERLIKIVDPSLIVDEDLLEEVWAMAIVANACLNPKASKRPPMRHVLKALENPLKIVREENTSSARLRTNSSSKSWSTAFFGSWRHSSSSESAAAAVNSNKGGTSDSKKSGKVGSQSSGGNDHSSSNKRSSNEIFPEPLDMQDVEARESR
ncbi:probable LRR receptor-like serine/threonine-protein kinase At2g16250 [Abrus precatorius]|uniref:Probable LRR receptor-like serine/threonine-protein kinase At2g16250 n=1 Tax=Abrus precatorius TaxID=3816 RepID=A0A8B8JMM2_ABRPR|nr:probable LRR receptor-like serine/threonine-protein kinase At2g16250 [Abrus precatorius]XP_027332519.1 probable LRR receptor-like serine/threonine-protein kinase At2g16250 [Abrus precatorius]XP_027332520.1 probable LRR receptor-like serine/threonine-protein kinase At2g16250 [Abrus precatorius]XP_027332521.1 probable LRR receptor-like serine/threonine-protein kinase At2g16250 [Abrus precatorius]XP_027332522.1 probable LRR receptor-like serine/threonine-protein kinase At2g16250 [Abrus precator